VLRKLKPLWLLPILCATSACVSGSTAPLVVSDYCRIAKPIGYDSTRDSAATIKEVEDHNSKWVCVCDKDCPAGVVP
jgi:hypothetical protein